MAKDKVRKLYIVVIASMIAMIMSIVSVYTYAWLSTSGRVTTADGEKKFARLGMKLDLLFDILDSDKSAGKTILTKNDGTTVTYDQNAEWGTAANPYIISDIRHLQNLSILQEIGYFDDRYISKNFSGGVYQNTSTMPYFLVCNPDGTPVAVDGDGVEFSPIGSDEYPFIGYVGGAFVAGDAEVNNMTSDTSTLYNIHTVTTTDVTDVGLFGTIGYLGEETLPSESNPTPTFTGYTSTVKDLLLYDVTVSVRNPSWQEVVAGHHFSYSKAGEFADELPHENHHIGILAGHVEYATVENISVYYSDNNICAIDLLHTNQSVSGSVTPNYSSSTGIMGMLYNMNPVITGSTIGVGTGTNDSDLSINAGGAGTGGGLISGTGRGYITASNIYDKYQHNGGIYSYTEGDYEKDAFVVYYTAETSRVRTGRNTYVDTHYKLEDGTPLVFTTEGGKPVMQYWYTSQNFWGQTNYNHTSYDKFLTKESDGKYYYLGNTSREITEPKKTGVYIRLAADENGNNLCQQYVRDRLGNFGTQRMEMYYFKDGVFTFALSDAEDKIEATWKGDEADKFTIGPTNDAGWGPNYDEGASAAVAITSDITNMTELNNAIAAGKKIIVVYERDGNDYILDLSKQAAKVGNNGATIYGDDLVNLPDDLYNSLKEAYMSGKITEPANPDDWNITINQLKDNWDDYHFYYFGSTSENSTFDDLKNRFNITVTPDKASGKILYTAENGAQINESDMTATEVTYNTYKDAEYDGFFLMDVHQGGFLNLQTYYRVRYYSSTANGIQVQDSTNRPNFAATMVKTENGATIYSYTSGRNTYTGILIDETGKLNTIGQNNQWVASSTDVSYSTTSGSVYARWEYGIPHQAKYIIQDNTGETVKYYQMADNGLGTVQVYNVNATGETTDEESGLLPLYLCAESSDGETSGNKYILISKDFSYTSTFSHDSNYLQIVSAYSWALSSWLRSGNVYLIWNGANSSAIYGNYYRDANNNANLVFNNDKTVSISYTINNITRYLSYGNNNFTYLSSKQPTCKFKLYAIEAMDKAAYGRITFDPKDDTSPNAYTFNADEYLLWPNSTMTGASIGSGATMTADPSYSIKQLGVDLTSEKGWKNSLGQPLSKTDLYKKFTMGKGIGGQDTVISLGGSLSFGDSGILTAPIGSTGEKADIPTGCVAFRVNSAATETKPHKIRVIVAVPVSEYYYQEKNVTDTMDYINDYYFALWQVPAAGSNLYTNFNFQSAKEVFELPRSFKYSPEVGPDGNIKDGVSKYTNIKYGGKDYRCYLNGDRILVAYEFAVTDIGVYILGSNHPTQIVYFSADATVSAGRDGTSGSLLGSIDFVYDNSAVKPSGSTTKVVTVTQGPTDDMDKTFEDYNYYYSSLSLMYTDNTGGKTEAPYPDVNDFKAYIRRTATGGDDGTTTLTANITGSDESYVGLRRYSEAGDTIVRNGAKQ